MSQFGDGSFEHPRRLARDVTAAFAWAEKEIDELRAEVERLEQKNRNNDIVISAAIAEVERLKSDKARLLCRVYNSGYTHGHHDTVEAQYTDIHRSDMETYHADEVAEIDAAMKGDK